MRHLLHLASLASFAPLHAQEPVDFDRQVAPILVGHCIDCHGPEKAKGGLRLDTRATAFPTSGGTIVPKEPEASELLHRVTLPPGDVDIMPAVGGPLSAARQELLRRWIVEGALWPASGDGAIAAALAARRAPKLRFDLPALAADEAQALERAVASLRASGVSVQRIAADTEALEVNLSRRGEKVGDAEVALLAPLAKRLVWLDLSRTAVSDEGLASLVSLTELRRIHVANTKVGDLGLAKLAVLPKLETLNAYGTALGDAGLAALAESPSLRKLHAWRTAVSKEGALAAARNPRLAVELGDEVEARLAAAQKEQAEREAKKKAEAESGASVNTTCPVSGSPVDPKCVVQDEGRRVGFCCEVCKAKFVQDPGSYRAKLPK